MKILNAVKDFLNEYNIRQKTVLMALSGGCDSVVLLDILNSLKKEFELNIVVIHLNHNWRGEESFLDMEFSKNFAKKLGFEFYFETLNSSAKKTEETARVLRYEFFEHAIEKFKASACFLAHNKNDNAETLLYRTFKGTGLKGLCGIPKKRDKFFRPLIEIERDEIEKYAKTRNLAYVSDSSNDDIKYKRNLIRKEILPLAKKINPEIINSLSNLAVVSNMQFEIINEAVKNAKNVVFEGEKIVISKFKNLSLPLQTEILNDFLKGKLKNRDFKRIKMYLDFTFSNKRKISVNSELFLEKQSDFLFFSKKINAKKINEEIKITGTGEFKFLDKTLIVSQTSGDFDFKKEKGKYLNLDFSNLTLRTRKEGDIFCPFGSNVPQKLKTYLIKKKIPRQVRENLLLLTHKNEVLCICGIEISQKAKISDTKKVFYKLEVI